MAVNQFSERQQGRDQGDLIRVLRQKKSQRIQKAKPAQRKLGVASGELGSSGNVLAVLYGWWWNSHRFRHPDIMILLKGQIAELKI